jgi:hypothetical protein
VPSTNFGLQTSDQFLLHISIRQLPILQFTLACGHGSQCEEERHKDGEMKQQISVHKYMTNTLEWASTLEIMIQPTQGSFISPQAYDYINK